MWSSESSPRENRAISLTYGSTCWTQGISCIERHLWPHNRYMLHTYTTYSVHVNVIIVTHNGTPHPPKCLWAYEGWCSEAVASVLSTFHMILSDTCTMRNSHTGGGLTLLAHPLNTALQYLRRVWWSSWGSDWERRVLVRLSVSLLTLNAALSSAITSVNTSTLHTHTQCCQYLNHKTITFRAQFEPCTTYTYTYRWLSCGHILVCWLSKCLIREVGNEGMLRKCVTSSASRRLCVSVCVCVCSWTDELLADVTHLPTSSVWSSTAIMARSCSVTNSLLREASVSSWVSNTSSTYLWANSSN